MDPTQPTADAPDAPSSPTPHTVVSATVDVAAGGSGKFPTVNVTVKVSEAGANVATYTGTLTAQ